MTEQLRTSHLSDQLEALGDELDLQALELVHPSLGTLPLLDTVTGGGVARTIEGASTLRLELNDYSRIVWRSGFLTGAADVNDLRDGCDLNLDGLWWRLAKAEKNGDVVTCTFEEREVAVLRAWPLDKALHTAVTTDDETTDVYRLWSSTLYGTQHETRLRFAWQLVKDVRGVIDVGFEAPGFTEPDDTGPPVAPTDPHDSRLDVVTRQPGLPPGFQGTIKGSPANANQRDNIGAVLDVGHAMTVPDGVSKDPHGGVRRKILVAAVMTLIQESGASTQATNGVHVGLFQQASDNSDAGRYWRGLGGGTRDPRKDAHAFFTVAIERDTEQPDLDYYLLCEAVQNSGKPLAYAPWRQEAEAWADAYGIAGADTADPKTAARKNHQRPATPVFPDSTMGATNQFTRGHLDPKSRKFWIRENNWDCLGRTAEEIHWRRFVVSGTVYFTNDYELFKSRPIMRLSESDVGVDAIDGDYDIGKQNAACTVTCRIGLWQAPPGSVVEIADGGMLDGRWLVATISRPLFSPEGTVTLTRPRPLLPEAQAPEAKQATSGATTFHPPKTPPKPKTASKGGTAGSGTGVTDYIFPVPADLEITWERVDMGKDLRTGVAGIGRSVLAIGDGTIVRISNGGGFGPWYTVLLLDPDWQLDRPFGPDAGKAIFYGHCDSPQVQVGQHVNAGQPILKCRGVGSGGVPLAGLPGHMEIGWAFADAAKNYTMLAYFHYREGDDTPEGEDFAKFLLSIERNRRVIV